MAGAEAGDGDNRDGECFFYEPDGDGLRIVGLTEKGRSRERLVLPVSRDGVPVISLAPETLAGNTRVREVVVQSNLRGLEDGSFDGCAALERLVSAQLTTSTTTAEERYLDGFRTGAKFMLDILTGESVELAPLVKIEP